MIEVERLTRRFGPTRALENVSFSIGRGRVVGLIGHNSSGKTTLFRVLSGLLRPDTGRVLIAGVDIAQQPRTARERSVLLTEEPGLPDRLTPLWHVELHAGLRGANRREALTRAREALRLVGLQDMSEARIGSLSKGKRQRVALARALVADTAVLLLDEPTTSLDMENSSSIRAAIRRRADEGASVLLATHDASEVEQICDELLVLRHGRVVERGTLGDVIQRSGGQSTMKEMLKCLSSSAP